MLSSSSNHFQSLSNIHPYFYDPIEPWLEENLQERVNVNKLLLVHTSTIVVHNVFRFIYVGLNRFILLLLIFDVYIHAENTMLEWLH